MGRTALLLFSGGQDSILATKLLQHAGITVIALNFVSHFFGGPTERITSLAEELSIPVFFIPFHVEQMAITVSPKYGRGKNFNACIDCHALMIRTAGRLLKHFGADFIATGEVLGQRPMSQNAQALGIVAQLSGYSDVLIRPLSGALLAKTDVEERGFIARSEMRTVHGKSCKGQVELAKELGIEYIMQGHGGGCPLTTIPLGNRLRRIYEDGFLHAEGFIPALIRSCRFLRIGQGQYCFIGRRVVENKLYADFARFGTLFDSSTPECVKGPSMLLVDMNNGPVPRYLSDQHQFNDIEEAVEPGACNACNQFNDFNLTQITGSWKADEELISIGLEVYSIYSKGKGKCAGIVRVDGQVRHIGPVNCERMAEIKCWLLE